jgi:type I restriction enzyme S subunit
VTELPEGWERVRLDHVAEVKLGRQRSPRNHSGKRMRPYLRAANVTWSGLDLSDVKEMNFTEDESRVFELRSGDLLLAEASGSASEVGKPAMWRDELADCCFQNTLVRVRSYGPLPEYLLQLFRAEAISGRLGDAARGVGIHHIGATRLSAWPTPIPPLDEQRRIVAVIEEQLSRLDAAEASLGRGQLLIGILRRAAISHVVDGDWPRRPWRELGRAQNGRAFPSRDYAEEGIKLLRPGNLHASGRVVWTGSNTRHLPERYRDEFPTYVVGPGELIMNLTAQSLKDEFLGRVCLTGREDECLLNQRLARLSATDLDIRYLLYVLKARPFRRFVDSLNKGSLIQHMFTTQLDNFEVPVPSMDEQRRLVRELERQLSVIESLSSAIDDALRRARVLRRAIFDSALKGKLVPQDPEDEPVDLAMHRVAATQAATGQTAGQRGVRA